MVSSGSSCFGRLERPLLVVIDEAGREAGSLFRGADSEAGESGDLEVLVEAEGAERLPERRVSRGERGGPIVAVWAMIRVGRCNSKRVSRLTLVFRAGNNTVISSSMSTPLPAPSSSSSSTRLQPGHSVCPSPTARLSSSPSECIDLGPRDPTRYVIGPIESIPS